MCILKKYAGGNLKSLSKTTPRLRTMSDGDVSLSSSLKENCKCKKIVTKLCRFEKIPKEINDMPISMTLSLITLRKMLVNINELRVLHHRE